MPVNDADIGFGIEVERWDKTLATPAFVAIGQLIDVTPPGLSRDTTEATHHQSPGRFREYLSALRDAGEVTFTIQYSTPTAMDGIIADFMDDDPVNYKITFPDDAATEWTVSGIVTNIDPETPLDDRMTADVTIKVTGEPDYLP